MARAGGQQASGATARWSIPKRFCTSLHRNPPERASGLQLGCKRRRWARSRAPAAGRCARRWAGAPPTHGQRGWPPGPPPGRPPPRWHAAPTGSPAGGAGTRGATPSRHCSSPHSAPRTGWRPGCSGERWQRVISSKEVGGFSGTRRRGGHTSSRRWNRWQAGPGSSPVDRQRSGLVHAHGPLPLVPEPPGGAQVSAAGPGAPAGGWLEGGAGGVYGRGRFFGERVSMYMGE